MTVARAIRVIVADPGQTSRDELDMIVGGADDVEIIGRPATSGELDEVLESTEADVVLVDLAMRGLDAYTLAGRLSSNGDGPRVLMMAQRNDSRYVARALHAGAAGYLLKDRAYEELADALRRVASGGVFVSSGIAGIAHGDGDR